MKLRKRHAISTVLALIAVPLAAQQSAISAVTIVVTDPTAAPVPHAEIRVVPAPDPAPAKMETDSAGRLSLQLKPGSYALYVRCPGFKMAAVHFEVSASKDTQTVPVGLQLAPSGSPTVYSAAAASLRLSAQPYHDDVVLSPADFKALPHISITVHNAHSNTDETYSGVPLADLLAKVNAPLGKELRGIALTHPILATGSDGYQVVLALAEIDPEFHTGTVLVADGMNGQPLDSKSGPFKLVVTEDKRPARWVRNLISIEVHSAKNP